MVREGGGKDTKEEAEEEERERIGSETSDGGLEGK